MAEKKGVFIVLEGIDGTGKSTQAKLIEKWFRESGFDDIVMTREPGGTPLAEKLRGLLKDKDSESISDKGEVLLFFAAREQHLNHVIRPALERGAIVICDRFIDSTYAYQAAGGANNSVQELAWELGISIVGETWPDRNFVLTMDPAKAAVRGQNRGEADRLEMKGADYYIRAQNRYEEIAKAFPKTYTLVDADMEPMQVHAQMLPVLMDIKNTLRARFSEE